MENEIPELTPELTPELNQYKLSFDGKGSTFFGIVLVNWLLKIVTLSFYQPWAKVKQLKYTYSSTMLNDDRFSFNGTGKEMFRGYIKALVIFGLIFGIFFLLLYLDYVYSAAIFIYFALILIFPFVIHGSYRYRMSRTSWRGIRFGYRGNRSDLFVNFFKWIFFTIITLGIYGSWMEIKMRRYLIGNVRAGDVEFHYKGKGKEYFFIGLKGLLITIITLGIYSLWFYKKLIAYYVDNIYLHKNGKEIRFKSTLTAGDMFQLIFVNYVILIFTLGLGYAWVVTRSMTLIFSRIQMEGNIDLDTIQQTEDDFNDATGDDMTSFLDINLII